MPRQAFGSIVLLGGLVLAGCAANFVRPDPGTLKLGETTYADVIQRFGAPGANATFTKWVNGKSVRGMVYSYATSFATASDEPNEPGVFPGRSIAYYFLDDTLVGYYFTSSFKSDNSDFRDENVGRIEKGKSSRADVIRLVGEPTGYFIAPLVKSTSGTAFVYQYHTSIDRPLRYGGPMPGTRKSLIVSFDESGLVSEIKFSTRGTKP